MHSARNHPVLFTVLCFQFKTFWWHALISSWLDSEFFFSLNMNIMPIDSMLNYFTHKITTIISRVYTHNDLYLFQHLNNLLEHYLEPLKRETFLSNAEIAALFGNIQEIVTFQRQFLQNLEEALDLEPDFHKFDHSSQFKVRFRVFSLPFSSEIKLSVFLKEKNQ